MRSSGGLTISPMNALSLGSLMGNAIKFDSMPGLDDGGERISKWVPSVPPSQPPLEDPVGRYEEAEKEHEQYGQAEKTQHPPWMRPELHIFPPQIVKQKPERHIV